MALRSQLITKEFPELDRVERLNNEAFPEEERIPLSEFLQLDGRDDYHFFAFYDEDDFVGFASVLYNAKVFYVSFFAIVPQMRSHGYGSEIIDKLVDFYGPSRSMVLEVEAWMNLTTILSNVWRVGISISVMVLRLPMPSWNMKV